MDTNLHVPQGRFHLRRLPRNHPPSLRAWDAADEYLLAHLAEQELPAAGSRVLIVNDSFGSLAVALAAHRPQALSDSWLAQQATRDNLAANGLAADAVTLHGSLNRPDGPIDLLLIKLPKTLALLEDELCRLRPLLAASCRIIAAAMIKGLPSSAWQTLERILGPTTPSLAWKKARLIQVALDHALPTPGSPYPTHYTLEGTEWRITNHANVFSRDSLDIGTRLFLRHLPVRPAAREIIDLGCGNGVIGLCAARDNPEAKLHFIDESVMAIASARDNFQRIHPGRDARFHLGNGLDGAARESADLILCNPPFHQQQTIGDQIALAMFRQACRVLRTGGELWVVGNRHLGYHQSLGRLFGRVETVASDRKFVVLCARKG